MEREFLLMGGLVTLTIGLFLSLMGWMLVRLFGLTSVLNGLYVSTLTLAGTIIATLPVIVWLIERNMRK